MSDPKQALAVKTIAASMLTFTQMAKKLDGTIEGLLCEANIETCRQVLEVLQAAGWAAPQAPARMPDKEMRV